MEEMILRQKVARLEFEHDQLLSELMHIDRLLRSVGFSEGLQTIKGVALEILDGEVELD